MSVPDNLDLNLDSTPIIEWLANALKEGKFDRDGIRRSLIARLIWKVSFQPPTALIGNVTYLLGRKIWCENPRQTLASDILCLRQKLRWTPYRLSYSRKSEYHGFYFHGRPTLDPQLERRMVGAMSEIDPAQMAIISRLSSAQRFAQMASIIEFTERVGALQLRERQPFLNQEQALYKVRTGQVS